MALTADSIWLIVSWPSSESIAFRLAFGLNAGFENINLAQQENDVRITVDTKLGSYNVLVNFPDEGQAMFRYTTRFRAVFPFLLNFYPRDILPLPKKGRIENTSGKIHAFQEGSRSGQLYFSMTKPKNGSVFYLQNLSAISPYCEACGVSVAGSVGGDWPELGFQFPLNPKQPIPAGNFNEI